MRNWQFFLAALAVGVIAFIAARMIGNDYVYFAGYVVLQFVVLATAWNILGGYCGYVNFGSAAFFAMGAYTTVALNKFPRFSERYLPESFNAVVEWIFPLPIPVLIVLGGLIAGLVGLGTGYLTLRLRGVFFAIATWQPGLGPSFRHYITSVSGIFFWQRVLFGLAAPALLGYLTWETAKIRSTQSATGILYVDFFTIVVGELLAKYLLLATRVPV